MRTAGHIRHVHVNFRGLSNAIEPSNALFKQFGIERQIEQNKMMRELKVPAFAADFGADQDPCPVFLGEPGCVSVALNQRQTFVKDGDLHVFDALAQRRIDGSNASLRAAYQKNLFRIDAEEEARQPVQHGMPRFVRM